MAGVVTVAIPVLDGEPDLRRTLAAVAAQKVPGELELLVCDSGSRDQSVALARAHGAEVIEIAAAEFGHGRTRNLLMERSRGAHVAFLTQDAEPQGELWLARLLAGFELAPDVGLVFGPYIPRPEASPMVARELSAWFGSFAPQGQPRIDSLAGSERTIAPRTLLGHRGFFTDANGCISRVAWEQVPFRDVAYAEDHLLAQDMLRAGFVKAYVPDAAVIHSHDYSSVQWLRRSFDEARAMHEVYEWVPAAGAGASALRVWAGVGADWRWFRERNADDAGNAGYARSACALLARSTTHHAARAAGTLLGGRADRLAPALVRRLSLERRAS